MNLISCEQYVQNIGRILNELTSLFCWMTINATCLFFFFSSPFFSSRTAGSSSRDQTGSMNELIVVEARKRETPCRNVTGVKTNISSRRHAWHVWHGRTNERMTVASSSVAASCRVGGKFRVTTRTCDDVSAEDVELCAQSSPRTLDLTARPRERRRVRAHVRTDNLLSLCPSSSMQIFCETHVSTIQRDDLHRSHSSC